MGRHARDEDPAPRRTDRPSEPRRPSTGGPPRQATGNRPVQPGHPRPTAHPGIPRPTTPPFPPRPAESFPPRPADSLPARGAEPFPPPGAEPLPARDVDYLPPRDAEPFPARDAEPFVPRSAETFPPQGPDSFAPRDADPFSPRATDQAPPSTAESFAFRPADAFRPRPPEAFPAHPADQVPPHSSSPRPAESSRPRGTDHVPPRATDSYPPRFAVDPLAQRPAGELFQPGTPSASSPRGGTSSGPRRDARAHSGVRQPVEVERRRSPGETTGSHRTATSTGSHRTVESTGGHRAVGEATTNLRRITSTTNNTGTGTETTTLLHRTGEDTDYRSRGGTSGQTATGTHRAMGKVAGRRRIAKWPLVAGGFVVLLVVGLLGWGWANNVLNSRAEAQAAGCADGDATMKVLVAPAVEKPIGAAAASWNQAKTVVHAHCIHINVTPVASDQALKALTGSGNLDAIGGMPAAWIAENTPWIGQLQSAKPAMIAAPAESIAYAPSADYDFVGLTGTNLDEVQARAAQVFRDYLREPAQKADFTAAGLTPR